MLAYCLYVLFSLLPWRKRRRRTITITYRHTNPRRTTTPCNTIARQSAKASIAEAKRERKAAQEAELAVADIDRMEAQKMTLVRLLDSIEAELENVTDQRRITTLLSKQASVENRLYGIDRRIDRAYMTAHQ